VSKRSRELTPQLIKWFRLGGALLLLGGLVWCVIVAVVDGSPGWAIRGIVIFSLVLILGGVLYLYDRIRAGTKAK
jgi:hypothetical protein